MNDIHVHFFFNDIPLHKPPLQASASPIPKIRMRLITGELNVLVMFGLAYLILL